MRVAALYGDRLVAERDDEASRWCRDQLGDALLDEVRRWPLTLELGLEIGREGRTAADWALLGADVALCSTGDDHVEAAARIRATGSPVADEAAAGLLSPHTAQEATSHLEGLRGA